MSLSLIVAILGVVALVLAVAYASIGYAIIALICFLIAAAIGGHLRA